VGNKTSWIRNRRSKRVETSVGETLYEVRVKVRNNNKRYSINTYTMFARDHIKAMERARKFGEPLSVNKVDKDASHSSIEFLNYHDTQPDMIGEPIKMEMIWRKNGGKHIDK
jgi:hypothetical protein